MRTSRLSKETTRMMAALNAPIVTTRSLRSTPSRSTSLQQFTHQEAGIAAGLDPTAVGSERSSSTASRKRKRDTPLASPNSKVKLEVATSSTTSITTAAPPKKRRQPAKIKKAPGGEIVCTEPPSDWQQMYDVTMEMRRVIPAPVDTMGCERLADTNAPLKDQRFQTLVSLMLSSQTKDQVTAAAIRRMQAEIPGSLTVQTILAMEPAVLNDYIGKVGFHNIKTKNIKKVAEILRDEYDGDIPDSIEGLVSLPGVGPKMAHLTLSAAWGRTEGIGVDVHVHRITNLWKWHTTKTPEETRMALQSWLPKEKWHEINWLLVGLGQTICLPIGRKCGDCQLGVRRLCPAAVGVKREKKEAKIEIKTEDGDVLQVEETIKVEEREQEDVGLQSSGDIEDIGRSRRRIAVR